MRPDLGPIPSPPYKAPNRRWYTEGLFWELNNDYRIVQPVFSLYQDIDFGGRPLVNCRKAFIEARDPTGYKWAMAALGGEYAHFKLLCEKEWFASALSAWQEELDVLLKSEALAVIEEASKGTSQSAFQAAKYLANLEHRKVSGRGRPSKAEVLGELKRAADQSKETDDDYNRVFIPTPNEGVPN